MTDVSIRVHGLNKSFRSAEVLKDVNFEVNRGEIYALLVPTGVNTSSI